MTRILVEGIGALGGFGVGIGAMAQALEEGRAPLSSLAVPTGTGTVELPAFRADTEPLKEFVSPKVLRRMDHFTKMGLLGAHLALADAGLGASGQEGMGVVVASGFGATGTTYALLDSIINDGDACTSPTHFANSLHNACAANIAIVLGTTGPNLTVSQFGLSVPSALLTARQWLLDRRVERVLFGAVDELSDLIGYLWYRQRGLPRPDALAPLSTAQETAIPGEGAVFFVLSRVDEARTGYCTLDAVSVGRGQAPATPAPHLMLIGADGRRDLGTRYAAAAEGSRLACYTPLFGSTPAGPAFDLAAAALMLKNGRVYPTPGVCDFPARLAPAGALDAGRISCLGLAEEEGYGVVELGRIGL